MLGKIVILDKINWLHKGITKQACPIAEKKFL